MKPQNEKLILFAVLAVNLTFMVSDILDDLEMHESGWHIFFEVFSALLTLTFLVLTLTRVRLLNRRQAELSRRIGDLQIETEEWKRKTSDLREGFARAIDEELSRWSLTNAEKEVALLLLKGLSLKEIAQVRNTSEQTVKQQSSTIYKKSGLGGRSELLAYFLEDIVSPPQLPPPH